MYIITIQRRKTNMYIHWISDTFYKCTQYKNTCMIQVHTTEIAAHS